MSTTPTEIHERLKRVRLVLGITQAEFAAYIGLTLRSYVNYENGSRALPIAAAVTACKTFEVRTDWLFLGKGRMQDEVEFDDYQPAEISMSEPAPDVHSKDDQAFYDALDDELETVYASRRAAKLLIMQLRASGQLQRALQEFRERSESMREKADFLEFTPKKKT